MTEVRALSPPQHDHGDPCVSTSAERPARIVYYEGERIYFRPIELTDEALLRRWINDPQTWRTLGCRRPINALAERQWIESNNTNDTDYVFGIVVKDDDRLIGTTGLHRIRPVNRSSSFGIAIGEPSYRNRGYGAEATGLTVRFGFEELNLHRIELSVFANNPRAIQCYQKAGFINEGCLREAMYRNGRFIDEYKFAILKDEWESGRDGVSPLSEMRP